MFSERTSILQHLKIRMIKSSNNVSMTIISNQEKDYAVSTYLQKLLLWWKFKIIKSISRLLGKCNKTCLQILSASERSDGQSTKIWGSINFLHRASAEILLNVSCWGRQLIEEKAAPVFNVKWTDAFYNRHSFVFTYKKYWNYEIQKLILKNGVRVNDTRLYNIQAKEITNT